MQIRAYSLPSSVWEAVTTAGLMPWPQTRGASRNCSPSAISRWWQSMALGIAAGNDDLGFIEMVADSGTLAFFTGGGEEAVFHAHAHIRPEGGIGKGGDVTGHGIGHKIFHRTGLVLGRFRGISQQAAAIEGQTGRQHEEGGKTFHEFSWRGKAGSGARLSALDRLMHGVRHPG